MVKFLKDFENNILRKKIEFIIYLINIKYYYESGIGEVEMKIFVILRQIRVGDWLVRKQICYVVFVIERDDISVEMEYIYLYMSFWIYDTSGFVRIICYLYGYRGKLLY